MYSVTVKIEGIESRRRSAGLLHIVIGFFLIAKGADYYRFLDFKTIFPTLPVFAVAFISLAYGFFRRRIDYSSQYNYWLRLLQVVTFTTLGVIFTNLAKPMDYFGVFIFAFLCILLMFSERRIFLETTIFLDKPGVQIPGYYRDHLLKWEELSEVVV